MKSKIVNLVIRKYNDKADRGALLGIERTCMWQPWNDDDFEATMQDPFNITHVAEIVNGSDSRIIGYANFDITDPSVCDDHRNAALRHIYLYRIAVLPAYRRCGVGRELLRSVKDLLSHQGTPELVVSLDNEVRQEGKLKACRFFAGCEFESPVDHEWPTFLSESETLIVPFTYRLPGGAVYKNRIAKYFHSPVD